MTVSPSRDLFRTPGGRFFKKSRSVAPSPTLEAGKNQAVPLTALVPNMKLNPPSWSLVAQEDIRASSTGAFLIGAGAALADPRRVSTTCINYRGDHAHGIAPSIVFLLKLL